MTVKRVGNMACVLAALAAVAGATAPAAAGDPAAPGDTEGGATTSWVAGASHRLRLVAARTGTGGARRLSFGLEFRLDPEWKIFWRTPGEAGLPPHADFSGSANLASAEIRWPRPVRFSEFGITSWGYKRHVVLPLDIIARDTAAPVTVAVDLRYQVCREICVLGEAMLSLTLPAGAGKRTAAADAIARFRARIPVPFEISGFARTHLTRLAVRAAGSAAAPRLEVVAAGSAERLRGAKAIVETPQGVRVAARPASRRTEGGTLRLSYPVRQRPGGPALTGLPVTVTLLGNGFAVERRLRVGAPE